MYETLAMPDIIIGEKRKDVFDEEKEVHLYAKSYIFDKSTVAVQSVVVDIDSDMVSISSHRRDISNVVNKIKTPDRLLYVATKVRRLIERIPHNEQVTVNPTGVIEVAYVDNPPNTSYNENRVMSIENLIRQGKLTNKNNTQGESNMAENEKTIDTFKQENPWYTLENNEGILAESYFGEGLNFHPFNELEILENQTGEKTYDDLNLSGENYGKSIIYADVRDFEDKRKLVDRYVTEDFYKEDLYERELCVETTEEYDWKSDLTSFKEFIVNKVQSGSEINKEELGKEWQKINDKYSLPTYSALEGSAPSVDAILKGVAILTEIKMNEGEVNHAVKEFEKSSIKSTDFNNWKIAESKAYINTPRTHQVYTRRHADRPDSELNRVIIAELSSKENALKFINQVEKYTHERQTSTDLKTLRKITNVLEKNETMTVMHPELGEILVEAGETGKSGYGLKHIIERRHNADKKNIDEISAITKLVIDATEKGEKIRENNRFLELEKDGIIALIRHKNTDKNSPWVLSGFASWGKEKEATVAIKTVIAQNGYTPEYSSFRNQVGAVIASLDKEYTKNQEMSSKKDLELEAKNIQGEKRMSDEVLQGEQMKEAFEENFAEATDFAEETQAFDQSKVEPKAVEKGATEEKKAFEPNAGFIYKDNVRKIVTSVKNGTAPFMMGDEKNGNIEISPPAVVHSAISGSSYKGANQLLAQIELGNQGLKDNALLTYKQAQDLGVGIKKGSHAINLTHYDSTNPDNQKVKVFPVFPASSVINKEALSQTEKMTKLDVKAKQHDTIVKNNDKPIICKDANPEKYLGSYLAACVAQTKFVTDEKTRSAFQKNFTKDMEQYMAEGKHSQLYKTVNKANLECQNKLKERWNEIKPKQQQSKEYKRDMHNERSH